MLVTGRVAQRETHGLCANRRSSLAIESVPSAAPKQTQGSCLSGVTGGHALDAGRQQRHDTLVQPTMTAYVKRN